MSALKSPHELGKLASIFGGLPILGVIPNSPAFHMGLRYGDILLQIGEVKIVDVASFIAARERYTETLALLLIRDGKEVEIELVLDPTP